MPGKAARRHFLAHAIAPMLRGAPEVQADMIDAPHIVKLLDQFRIPLY